MHDKQHSATALASAAARAAHLVVDAEPLIFRDTAAGALLGDAADEMLGYHRTSGDHIILAGTRAITTCRSRYTEERLAETGADQYVILGAGLDSYALRDGGTGTRVFEVDHPATQEWKRGLLADAGTALPPGLVLVPLDFEKDAIVRRLTEAGLDPRRPSLVSWLGVGVYLSLEAVHATLTEIAKLGPGTELVMDYMLPPGLRDAAGEEYAAIAARVVGERDEKYRTYLSPEEMTGILQEHGFDVAENLPLRNAVPAELWQRTDALRPLDFARLVRAVVTG